jgi:hypothetical protein
VDRLAGNVEFVQDRLKQGMPFQFAERPTDSNAGAARHSTEGPHPSKSCQSLPEAPETQRFRAFEMLDSREPMA